MLCLSDGSSEGIAGFLISVRISVLLLLKRPLYPWLLVGICTYGHCGDGVVDALID